VGESVCRREAGGRNEHVGRREAAEAAFVRYDYGFILLENCDRFLDMPRVVLTCSRWRWRPRPLEPNHPPASHANNQLGAPPKTMRLFRLDRWD